MFPCAWRMAVTESGELYTWGEVNKYAEELSPLAPVFRTELQGKKASTVGYRHHGVLLADVGRY